MDILVEYPTWTDTKIAAEMFKLSGYNIESAYAFSLVVDARRCLDADAAFDATGRLN
jgi:hypothetical protein